MDLAGTTKTGPNDASCVVWAIGKFYIYFFRVFKYQLMLYTYTVAIYKMLRLGGWR